MKNMSGQFGSAGFGGRPASLYLIAITFIFVLLSSGIAQSHANKRVSDSILGVKVGMSLSNAHEELERFGNQGSGESDDEKEEVGEHKEAWSLGKSEFSSVALKANGKNKIVWVTGFVRTGQEIPFERLGDLSTASRVNDSVAIWNVATTTGGYRIVAKGFNGKARVVYMLSLELPPVQ